MFCVLYKDGTLSAMYKTREDAFASVTDINLVESVLEIAKVYKAQMQFTLIEGKKTRKRRKKEEEAPVETTSE